MYLYLSKTYNLCLNITIFASLTLRFVRDMSTRTEK